MRSLYILQARAGALAGEVSRLERVKRNAQHGI